MDTVNMHRGGGSQNPLLPATYDIVWGGLSFVILLACSGSTFCPTFNRIVAERSEKIEGGIEHAKLMQAEAARSSGRLLRPARASATRRRRRSGPPRTARASRSSTLPGPRP